LLSVPPSSGECASAAIVRCCPAAIEIDVARGVVAIADGGLMLIEGPLV